MSSFTDIMKFVKDIQYNTETHILEVKYAVLQQDVHGELFEVEDPTWIPITLPLGEWE